MGQLLQAEGRGVGASLGVPCQWEGWKRTCEVKAPSALCATRRGTSYTGRGLPEEMMGAWNREGVELESRVSRRGWDVWRQEHANMHYRM